MNISQRLTKLEHATEAKTTDGIILIGVDGIARQGCRELTPAEFEAAARRGVFIIRTINSGWTPE